MGILDKKECFGSQGNDMLYGDSPDKCLDCDLFEKCHKITVSVSLQSHPLRASVAPWWVPLRRMGRC